MEEKIIRNLIRKPSRVGLASMLFLGLLLAVAFANDSRAQAAVVELPVALETHTVASAEPGVDLSLREKHMAGLSGFRSDRIVLLLEPFGVPSAEAFDANGYSLMDYLARQGFDVWALDFRGFGASGRPSPFNQPMMVNPPQIRSSDAVLDVESAMQYICSSRGVSRANVLGWSWGGVVASQYAGLHPEKMERLVVYGGMHAFLLPAMTSAMEDPNNPGTMMKMPAYQLAVPGMSLTHWNNQAKGEVPHTPEAEAELSRIFLASDPTSGTRTPPSIRRAMGPMVDLYEIWSGRPVFDASLIKSPTLIIRGDHDTFSDDPGFMQALTNAPLKRYVEISMATHWALYEPGPSGLLMSEISSFLSDSKPILSLRLTGAHWQSYADFLGRNLSVGFHVDNLGPETGHDLTVLGSLSTDGVLPLTPLPHIVGDVPGGSATSFDLKYLVPAGTAVFHTTVFAQARDGDGLPYFYPGPLPAA